jgi:hypothetical protein
MATPKKKMKLKFVTYCGLHCGLCAARSRIPERAAALQKAMAEEGWADWGAGIPGFAEFWRFLDGLHANGDCPGCRAGGGPPYCQIRVCVQQRGLELCNQCPDFPCSRTEALNAIYPTLIADNRHLQAVGLEQWLSEQEERARRGVVYADIRYQVDEAVRHRAFEKPEG